MFRPNISTSMSPLPHRLSREKYRFNLNSNISLTCLLTKIGLFFQMLLEGKINLSNSLQAALNGENLGEDDQADSENVDVMPSVLDPVDVDSVLSDISEGDESKAESENSRNGPSPPKTSKMMPGDCQEIPLPVLSGQRSHVSVTNVEIEDKENKANESFIKNEGKRKRRSLSEVSDSNPISQRKAEKQKHILFETDV